LDRKSLVEIELLAKIDRQAVSMTSENQALRRENEHLKTNEAWIIRLRRFASTCIEKVQSWMLPRSVRAWQND
jgi:regulator of replication initiation timing